MISGNYHRYNSAELAYVSVGEEGNINLVEIVGEQSIFCDWEDPGYTRKEKNIDECAETSRRQCCKFKHLTKQPTK